MFFLAHEKLAGKQFVLRHNCICSLEGAVRGWGDGIFLGRQNNQGNTIMPSNRQQRQALGEKRRENSLSYTTLSRPFQVITILQGRVIDQLKDFNLLHITYTHST